MSQVNVKPPPVYLDFSTTKKALKQRRQAVEDRLDNTLPVPMSTILPSLSALKHKEMKLKYGTNTLEGSKANRPSIEMIQRIH